MKNSRYGRLLEQVVTERLSFSFDPASRKAKFNGNPMRINPAATHIAFELTRDRDGYPKPVRGSAVAFPLSPDALKKAEKYWASRRFDYEQDDVRSWGGGTADYLKSLGAEVRS